jgi:hypothetical protein
MNANKGWLMAGDNSERLRLRFRLSFYVRWFRLRTHSLQLDVKQ